MAGLILVLSVIYTRGQPFEPLEEYTKILVVAQVCLVHILITAGIVIYVFFWATSFISFTANILGVVSAILTGLQYFPQIYTTFRLKHVGSLSIKMMCMQTPGGFAWAASLAAREGTTWSSWLPYLTAASLQCVLLIMALYFEYAKGNKSPVDEMAAESNESRDSVEDETTPLVR